MSNEHLKGQFHDILDGFRRSMDEIAVIKAKQAQLFVTGYAEDKRVMIRVDAQGEIVETLFADDISDLTYDEIAEAVTAAARAARVELTARSEEILQPLREQQAKLPSLTDLVAGLSEAGNYAPDPAGRDKSSDGPVAGESGVRESLW
ncbi:MULTISPECIES: YbaB/EbfC family nucleoid-associated protein [Nocardia]|uniref:YbaB/EbfC family nucleoid-associated protein n=1 Tax=Nocardia TaxID=1817 RepID=UPI0018956286|nr:MULTISPECIES: YbaB/EbfC family nucleoid-associated protein [Nocardia]MBF6351435.1 YbaB/EbfC family nucleoid-associated protein [Nocardia flavorosea]